MTSFWRPFEMPKKSIIPLYFIHPTINQTITSHGGFSFLWGLLTSTEAPLVNSCLHWLFVETKIRYDYTNRQDPEDLFEELGMQLIRHKSGFGYSSLPQRDGALSNRRTRHRGLKKVLVVWFRDLKGMKGTAEACLLTFSWWCIAKGYQGCDLRS